MVTSSILGSMVRHRRVIVGLSQSAPAVGWRSPLAFPDFKHDYINLKEVYRSDVSCRPRTSDFHSDWNRLVSQMRAPLAAKRLVANQQGSYDNCARCYMFLSIKRNIF